MFAADFCNAIHERRITSRFLGGPQHFRSDYSVWLIDNRVENAYHPRGSDLLLNGLRCVSFSGFLAVPHTLLYVDDRAAELPARTRAFATRGYTVLEANEGFQALKVVQERAIDAAS
jgi:hypothetical protein